MRKWWLLGGVTLLQLLVAVAMRIAPLRLVRGLAKYVARMLFVAPAAIGDDDRVVWAIQATGRRLGRISTCLVQAVAGEAVLGTPQRPVRFTIGVKRGTGGSLDAHAWVATPDRVLIGATREHYVQLVEWDGPTA